MVFCNSGVKTRGDDGDESLWKTIRAEVKDFDLEQYLPSRSVTNYSTQSRGEHIRRFLLNIDLFRGIGHGNRLIYKFTDEYSKRDFQRFQHAKSSWGMDCNSCWKTTKSRSVKKAWWVITLIAVLHKCLSWAGHSMLRCALNGDTNSHYGHASNYVSQQRSFGEFDIVR